MKKEDFIKYYSALTNFELLKIIEEKEKYQPDAIEAASEILSTRNYSIEELFTAQSEINHGINKKKEKQEKIEQIKNKVNDFVDEHFGFRERTVEKKLNVFCAVLFIYIIITALISISRMFRPFHFIDSKFYTIELLSVLLQLLLIYLLYKRNNWGWIGATGLYLFTSIPSIASFILYFRYKNVFLFSRSTPYPSLLSFIFCIAVVLFLNSKSVFSQFSIENTGRIATLIIALIISLIIIFVPSFM